MNSEWIKRLGAARVWMTAAALAVAAVIWLARH
jgi:hypothetical protein